MARKSFAFKLLLCLMLWTVVLWLLEVNFLSEENTSVWSNRKENSVTQKSTSVWPDRKEKSEPWLIIFWSTFFGKEPDPKGIVWKKGECPVPCEICSNRSRVNEANAFVIHAGSMDAHMIPPRKSVPLILLSFENPINAHLLTNPSFMSKFNLLISYSLASDFPDTMFTMPKLTPPLPFKDKDGFIMAAYSNCEPVRTEYMRQLMNFVPVDSYGACLRNKEGLVRRFGSENGKGYIQLKRELATKYKFTLVFFNQDCDYYVDEKLSDALDTGSVPVVMGTDKLDELLPGNLRHSVIKVRDFKSPQQLAEYLKFLSTNETEYNKYLEWKRKGLGNITGTVIGDIWESKYHIYCRICVALSQGKIHKEGLQPVTCKPRSFEDWGISLSKH